ncbi:MAG TPA: hypothetical protein DEQ02_07105 [Ruminococcaceae bacterium]|nr:hypothetical protein [Oscillospiraceae bacterium]
MLTTEMSRYSTQNQELQELALHTKNGDTEAMVEIVERWGVRLTAYIYRHLYDNEGNSGQWQDAEEIANDVFNEVFSHIDRWVPESHIVLRILSTGRGH